MQDTIMTEEMRRKRDIRRSCRERRDILVDKLICGEISIERFADISKKLREIELENG